MTPPIDINAFETAVCAAHAAEAKKARDVCMLRVGPVTTLAEYFLICTGESQAQLNAIADAIAESLAKQGHHPIGQERDRQGKWILLDYGDVVAHVMHPQAREFYDLESFWSHAAAVDASQWSPSARQAS